MITARLLEPRAACLEEGEILRLLDGTLREHERVEIEAHLDTCEPCRRLVGAVAGTVGPIPERATTLRNTDAHLRPAGVLGRGASIGRYLVLSLLGKGGMGAVYAAYDPELDRRVAIKLLLTADSAGRRALLVREARALGKLSHPNVVQVYDVGEHEGDVFVAMELVAGGTVDAWCRRRPRPGFREVLATYVDAARGLSAAHAKGIVHRDVKPANLLRGDDGRVRVADFGVAGARAIAGGAPEEGAFGAGSSIEAWVHEQGGVLGTPLYMAPEQHERASATTASDQYSFCVALYEGLFGRPPFAPKRGDRGEAALAALLAQKKAGPPGSKPPGSPVPARVYEALARGLAPDPDRRHPSMDALIAALDLDLTERQEREVRLRDLERDRDHTHGARPRFVMLSLLLLFSAGISLLGWRHPRFASIGHLILYALIVNGVVGVGLAAWHRQLLASQLGRMVTASSVVIGLSILGNRLIAWRVGTPVSHVLMIDMSMMSACLALGGLLVQGWRRPGLAAAATNAAGVALTVARPDLAVPVASWCAILSLAVLSCTAYRHATHAGDGS